MKNSLIVGLLCLGIGFGAAWVLKTSPSEETATGEPAPKNPPVAASKGSGGPSAQPTKSDNKPEDPKPSGKVVVNGEEVDLDEAEIRREMRSGQDRFREMMASRQKAKEEAQIKKLVDRLGLSDAQADQLRAYFDKNRADLTAMMEGGDEDWGKAKEFAKKLRGDGLEDELDKILTDEQKTAYDEMKQRDRANQIEARAYRDLAKVQGALDLSPEQKDQVYDILYQQAEQKIDANQDANAMVSVFTEGLGINIDPEDLGISGAIQVQIDKAAEGEQPDADPGAWMQAMQAGRQKQIDEKVETLAPALNEEQEAAYRAHLESQGAGLLGGFLGGVGTQTELDVEIDGIEIPAQPE